MQQGKTASTGVGWTNKVAQIRMSDKALTATWDRDACKVMTAYAKEHGT